MKRLNICITSIVIFGFMALLVLHSNVAHAASHHPQDFLKQIAGRSDEGVLIYQHYCANCHAQKPLIQLAAPRIGEMADWAPRVKKGFAPLLKHSNEGLNAMPARGGCFECTDKQLILAILVMLPESLRRGLVAQLDTPNLK